MYCNSYTKYSRFATKEVFIGETPLGGNNPIRIQSMTNTNTLDTQATVAQCIRIIEAGGEYVRITAPAIRDAENLQNIKNELRTKGYKTPLVADIHFNPNVAEVAATIVEKIRINPGNYIDKKKFEQLEFSDIEYKAEIEKIRERLKPLLEICKKHNTAIRIGTNHGSLSDRILSKYGDTPLGMVEATLEFLRICVEENFHNVVISLKSSNTRVMVQACRLLVAKMQAEGMSFPQHLGVTEAGEGEDGRIKSAVGIGALLTDGVGDTIRVSLTESPEAEIPVAKYIVELFKNKENHEPIEDFGEYPVNSFDYQRRKTISVENIGGEHQPIVIADFSKQTSILLNSNNELIPDYFYLGTQTSASEEAKNIKIIYDASVWSASDNTFPLFTPEEFLKANAKSSKLNFISIDYQQLTDDFISKIKNHKNVVFIIDSNNANSSAEQRAFVCKLMNNNVDFPIVIRRIYNESNIEHFQLKSASETGILFIDGLADGIWLNNSNDNISEKEIINTSFGILQACRLRMSKTEYISCPSCGRTLFDLQLTTAKIREKTNHLKGLKIGIMGCIVNGPGEMADADYGYVGTGSGKITLYKSKEVIKRNIPEKEAVDELINLIKEYGDWEERN